MESIVASDDPTVGQAMEALAKMESESAGSTAESAPAATPAPSQADNKASSPETKPAEGTPATADKAAEKTTATTDDKGTKTDATDAAKSRYSRAIERGFTNWGEFNAWKSEQRKAIEAEQAAIKAERDKLDADRKAIESERAKSAAPQYTPEDFERYAQKCDEEGKFDVADLARKHAANLRANPPAAPKDDKASEAEFQAQQKEWWGKAAVDFPNVVKENSPEANALVQLIKSEPAVLSDPKGMYYAARMVTAETAAARVPQLEKELGEARAKIKELDGKLTIPTDSIVNNAGKTEVPFEQQTPEQQWSEMERQARELDATGNWR